MTIRLVTYWKATLEGAAPNIKETRTITEGVFRDRVGCYDRPIETGGIYLRKHLGQPSQQQAVTSVYIVVHVEGFQAHELASLSKCAEAMRRPATVEP